MHNHRTFLLATAYFVAVATGSVQGGARAGASPTSDRGHTFVRLPATDVTVRAFELDGRYISLYGQPMAHGPTPQASAESFLRDHLGVFGVDRDGLREGVLHADGALEKGLMYDPDRNAYRFTLLRYSQYAGGVPVFRSELKLLVRNDTGFPLVMAKSSLHDLGEFRVDGRVQADRALARRVAEREIGAGAEIIDGPELVVWAGIDTASAQPTLATKFVAERGTFDRPDTYDKRLYIVDATTGVLLYQENQVLNVDVEGTVSAFVTEGILPDTCAGLVEVRLPYPRVNIGANVVFGDENGDFVISNEGGGDVTVQSRVWGRWFRSLNAAGDDALLEEVVTPPGPVDFVHNQSGEEFTTAEVNAYLHANIVRDWVLSVDPDFPIFDNAFELRVNSGGSCNAFYQGQYIVFLGASEKKGGCPNTAYSTVVYHEYGHHLVARSSGGGQEWGEGMADVSSILVTDEPEISLGFFGQCDEPVRSGDNDCRYRESGCSTCGSFPHDCGQIISGSVWDLRNELVLSEPDTYRELLSGLALGSLFLHTTGSRITPQVTIDYLVLDDDDDNIRNGTPHYDEIDRAFSAHDMDAPPLAVLEFELPDGIPSNILPAGGDTIRIIVSPSVSDPAPDSGILYVDDGNGTVEITMTEIETNLYQGVFPATKCGAIVKFYFSVDTTEDVRVFFPLDAPDDTFTTLSAADIDVIFDDDFEVDLKWSVTGQPFEGAWERGVPVDCGLGDPPSDGDGSGQCYVTENDSDDCNSDVDFGTTTLTSPMMDASDPSSFIEYYRWYSTIAEGCCERDDDFVIEVSDDAGQTWTTLEVIDARGPEAEGGWILKSFLVGDFIRNTDQFQIRFIAKDIDIPSMVEAGVDGVRLTSAICDACVEDIDGSGSVDFGDILAVLAAWGPCIECPEDLDENGDVGFSDLLIVLAAWGPCE